jgi:site-specific recombinase XerD
MSAQTPRPAGVHPESVSEMLGHSAVSIALDIYSHVMGSSTRK